jgi:hypothetical protein
MRPLDLVSANMPVTWQIWLVIVSGLCKEMRISHSISSHYQEQIQVSYPQRQPLNLVLMQFGQMNLRLIEHLRFKMPKIYPVGGVANDSIML